MKMLLFIGLSLWLGTTGCSTDMEVSPGQRTTMEVEEVFDAGEVVKGEFVTAKFTVKNTGDYPLVIAEVKAGCTCTVAQKPEEPIAPGKTGVIIAQVDTDKTGVGSVVKTVNIVSNSDPSTKVVTIKALVLKN